jgi:hypothetical protein
MNITLKCTQLQSLFLYNNRGSTEPLSTYVSAVVCYLLGSAWITYVIVNFVSCMGAIVV